VPAERRKVYLTALQYYNYATNFWAQLKDTTYIVPPKIFLLICTSLKSKFAQKREEFLGKLTLPLPCLPWFLMILLCSDGCQKTNCGYCWRCYQHLYAEALAVFVYVQYICCRTYREFSPHYFIFKLHVSSSGLN